MTATQLCEQFCSNPIGADGIPGTEDSRACCAECDKVIHFLTHEVLPAIRKHGHWTQPTADVDGELHAMIDQIGFRERLLEFLDPFEAARIDNTEL